MTDDEKNALTALIRRSLSYDRETGIFRWLVRAGHYVKVGDVAGHVRKEGYRYIRLNRKGYLAHRLAWLYVHGDFPSVWIDHADGNSDNNALSNLRAATKSQSAMNRRAPSHSKSGVKGVIRTARGKYRAYITKNNNQMNLGSFSTFGEALYARAMAARSVHGKFYRAD